MAETGTLPTIESARDRSFLDVLAANAWEFAALGALCFIFWRHLWLTLTVGSKEYEITASYITAFLVWQKRHKLLRMEKKGELWAIAPLSLLVIVSHFVNPVLLVTNGMLFVFCLTCWILLFYGRAFLRELAFALCFYAVFLFLFLKFSTMSNFSFQLRLISTKLAAVLLSLVGETPVTSGTYISISGFSSSIEPACSGMNNLSSFLIVGTLIAYYTNTRLWGKALLFLSAVPLAIFANSLRVTSLILLSRSYGALFAEGFWHYAVGVVTFMIAITAYPLLLEVLPRERQA